MKIENGIYDRLNYRKRRNEDENKQITWKILETSLSAIPPRSQSQSQHILV